MIDYYFSKLLYIGKSNKKFTNNQIYTWWGSNADEYAINIYVITNKNTKFYINGDYLAYYKKNFKMLNKLEYEKYLRKEKLKRISNDK